MGTAAARGDSRMIQHTSPESRRTLTDRLKRPHDLSTHKQPRLLNVDGLSPRTGIRRQLMTELYRLPFPAFLEFIAELLRSMGYHHVRRSGRSFWHGRTATGGWDLQATTLTGVSRGHVAVQVKRYERPVSRRFVDELRGAMSRDNARDGLLITTSRFAPKAHVAAEGVPTKPVRLVDGEELLEWMIAYRVGVRLRKPDRFHVDLGFFRTLSKRFPERRRSMRSRKITLRNESSGPVSSGRETSEAPSEDHPMTWRTHVLAGLNSLWLIQVISPTAVAELLPTLALAATLGALLPDLDAARSKLRYWQIAGIEPFLVPSRTLHRTLGHRGAMHSLTGLLFVGLILLPTLALFGWSSWPIAVALWLGYASHLVLDACTRSGIPLRWPARNTFHLLPATLRFTTGSPMEGILLPLLGTGIIALAAAVSLSGSW